MKDLRGDSREPLASVGHVDPQLCEPPPDVPSFLGESVDHQGALLTVSLRQVIDQTFESDLVLYDAFRVPALTQEPGADAWEILGVDEEMARLKLPLPGLPLFYRRRRARLLLPA